jgi:hypothetical protein
VCHNCGTRSFILVPYDPPAENRGTNGDGRVANLFAAGGIDLVARDLRVSKAEAARRIVVERALGPRIQITPEAAAWLVSHPDASVRQAAAKLKVSTMTAWRWRSALLDRRADRQQEQHGKARQ